MLFLKEKSANADWRGSGGMACAPQFGRAHREDEARRRRASWLRDHSAATPGSEGRAARLAGGGPRRASLVRMIFEELCSR
jgi:hypothetical protein